MEITWDVESVTGLVDDLTLFITFDLGGTLEPLEVSYSFSFSGKCNAIAHGCSKAN